MAEPVLVEVGVQPPARLAHSNETAVPVGQRRNVQAPADMPEGCTLDASAEMHTLAVHERQEPGAWKRGGSLAAFEKTTRR